MQNYELPARFYLGREFDLDAAKPTDELLLYDAKDLCTHAVCVGMTGSGKTGLCLDLLEEAAIDGIPAILIDPKGDLGNLLLAFPQLRPEDFRPWLDPGEAERKGQTLDELAAKTADTWRQGLANWDQTPERIQKFRDAVEVTIYTPGSTAGVPVTVLKSFAAPPRSIRENSEALRAKVAGAVSGVLALLGIEADPLRSREHILLSNLVERAWHAGRDLDLATLIREIQSPGIDQIGVLDLDSFFPQKERFGLAMALNNLLASPGFQTWLQGEPLDIQRMLYTESGKPRFAILSIAHLGDAERMFFLTILLNEVVAWMRMQSGSTSLRALLYMDEVFGYFPPVANPPTKTPMLTLLKQARAFGLGVMLATQNPVDLDYKGLANAGTWFLGRLQTERDKMRVLDGLEGASTQAGATFDRARMEQILSGLGNRVFLMNNVHEDEPVVFQSRWALSFLRGPLSTEQIRTVMAEKKAAATGSGSDTAPTQSDTSTNKTSPSADQTPADVSRRQAASIDRPLLPPGVCEIFLTARAVTAEGERLEYRPGLLADGKIHFSSAANDVDDWRDFLLLAHISPDAEQISEDIWDHSIPLNDQLIDRQPQPAEGASFADLPGVLAKPKSYEKFATHLKDSLYRSERIELWKHAKPKLVSRPGESEGDFRIRASLALRELRDTDVDKLRDKFATRLRVNREKIRKAQQQADAVQSRAQRETWKIGVDVLGSLFGRKTRSSMARKTAGAARSAERILGERDKAAQAAENLAALYEERQAIEDELASEIAEIDNSVQPHLLRLEPIAVNLKKSDITVDRVVLAWVPHLVAGDGVARPAI